MTRVSALMSGNIGNTITNYETWNGILFNVKEYGAKGNGVTDDTAAIQKADTAAVAGGGGPLYFPPGTYNVTALTLQSKVVTGSGRSTTTIRGTTASDHIITIPTDHFYVSGFDIVSTVAAASRTGAGMRITGGAEGIVSRVSSNGHKYGFWHQGPGNEFEHCFAVLNNSHGFFIDGSIIHQDEVGLYFCQSNVNGGDGFRVSGPGLGVRLTNITAAGNTAWGINIQTLNDIWITTPEISGNGGGINIEGSSDIQIATPFIETSVTLPNIWIRTSSMITITGGFLQGATSVSLGVGIIIEGTDVVVTGTVISSHKVCGIQISSAAVRATIVGVIVSNTASTGVTSDTAVLVNSDAVAFTLVGCDLDSITNPISGAVPAGAVILCKGLPLSIGNGWHSSSDTSINGYLEIVDSSGNLRKVATIA